jgi:hypothetical protein
MVAMKEAATEFFATKRIAVTGIGVLHPTADVGHQCMRFFLSMSGALPKQVS